MWWKGPPAADSVCEEGFRVAPGALGSMSQLMIGKAQVNTRIGARAHLGRGEQSPRCRGRDVAALGTGEGHWANGGICWTHPGWISGESKLGPGAHCHSARSGPDARAGPCRSPGDWVCLVAVAVVQPPLCRSGWKKLPMNSEQRTLRSQASLLALQMLLPAGTRSALPCCASATRLLCPCGIDRRLQRSRLPLRQQRHVLPEHGSALRFLLSSLFLSPPHEGKRVGHE